MTPSTQVLLMTIVFFKSLLFYVYGSFVFLCVCIQCVFSVHKEQKKMLDFLGQELQTVVSCHGGAGNEPRSFEGQQVHLMLSHLSNPIYYFSQSYRQVLVLSHWFFFSVAFFSLHNLLT